MLKLTTDSDQEISKLSEALQVFIISNQILLFGVPS